MLGLFDQMPQMQMRLPQTVRQIAALHLQLRLGLVDCAARARNAAIIAIPHRYLYTQHQPGVVAALAGKVILLVNNAQCGIGKALCARHVNRRAACVARLLCCLHQGMVCKPFEQCI